MGGVLAAASAVGLGRARVAGVGVAVGERDTAVRAVRDVRDRVLLARVEIVGGGVAEEAVVAAVPPVVTVTAGVGAEGDVDVDVVRGFLERRVDRRCSVGARRLDLDVGEGRIDARAAVAEAVRLVLRHEIHEERAARQAQRDRSGHGGATAGVEGAEGGRHPSILLRRTHMA